ncbi:hypothetical protein LQW54_002446 [Pestalotiopsis sp. IQ-011]
MAGRRVLLGLRSRRVELGMVMPRSGGEKNYLERIYRRPKYLFTCIIAMLYALFAGSPASSLAFGSYILHAAGYADAKERYESRAVAVGCVSVAVLLHGLRPKWGLRAIKALAFFKFALLTVIICAGFAALAGKRQVPDPGNFENLFAGAGSCGVHGYAAILLRLSYAAVARARHQPGHPGRWRLVLGRLGQDIAEGARIPRRSP